MNLNAAPFAIAALAASATLPQAAGEIYPANRRITLSSKRPPNFRELSGVLKSRRVIFILVSSPNRC
jgi:hypothetical protein